MSRQSKRSPSTLLTVSDVPSSATEPFAAMKRASSLRRLEGEARRLAESSRATIARSAVDVPADHVAAELVAELQRPFEVEARADVPVRRRW